MLLSTQLLPEMSKVKFGSHADFHASCTSATGTISGIAAHLLASKSKAGSVSTSIEGVSEMMAALRGHTRRLCEPEERFYNKQEFQGALEETQQPGHNKGSPSLLVSHRPPKLVIPCSLQCGHQCRSWQTSSIIAQERELRG